jgi:hypothetical protein
MFVKARKRFIPRIQNMLQNRQKYKCWVSRIIWKCSSSTRSWLRDARETVNSWLRFSTTQDWRGSWWQWTRKLIAPYVWKVDPFLYTRFADLAAVSNRRSGTVGRPVTPRAIQGFHSCLRMIIYLRRAKARCCLWEGWRLPRVPSYVNLNSFINRP